MSERCYTSPLSPEQLAALADGDIDCSDIPELDDTFWKNAKLIEPEGTQRARFSDLNAE
jgi:hypothetical protein